ncbi:MAG: precorrin-8X methylmutase [Methylococcaceae bacterium]|jgi:precorrin-8X/cobalt-precorrin-8 methylmutase
MMPCVSPKTFGIVLAGHGSRDPAGVQEFEQLVGLVKQRAPMQQVTHGYLEFASPTLDQAIQAQLDAHTQQIVMVPAVLLAASHAKNDMPSELLAFAQAHADVGFYFAAPLGLHPLLLQVLQERIIAAEAQAMRLLRRDDTCLVLVGRGTTDSDANGDVAKFARMLQEGMGFGTAFVCYAGTAKPLVADGLRTATQLGYARLIVVPFFLFDGVLVKRIYEAADAIQAREPAVDVLKVPYLGVHMAVAEVLIERAQEAIDGRAAMNCALCKYRVQIVGFEAQVGEPQRAHHLSVRGLLENTAVALAPTQGFRAYQAHPIEVESFRIIAAGRDWSSFPLAQVTILQRLVHTSGDFNVVDDLYFSVGAVEAGIRAILRCKLIVTDVTMVQTGLKRMLLEQLDINTWCGVHDQETVLLADAQGLTRSAAGIRRAWQKFGNDMVLVIGDAPTAIMEALYLIKQHGWRPQLIIGLPVGFVGTCEAKAALKRCLQVPRITNSGTRGGSPLAASVANALMIDAVNQLAATQPE